MVRVLKQLIRVVIHLALFTLMIRYIIQLVPSEYVNQGGWTLERPEYITTRAVEVAKSIMSLISFYILTRQFEFFSKDIPRSEDTAYVFGMLKNIKFIFLAIGIILLSVFLPDTAFVFFCNAIFGVGSTHIFWVRIILAAVFTVTAYFALLFGARSSAEFAKTNRKKDNTVISLGILALALPWATYIIVWVAMPLCYLVFMLLIAYWKAAVYAVLLIFALRTAAVLLKRKRFLSKIKRVSAENGYKLEYKNDKYRSLFFDTKGESFTLEADGETYSCKMIPTRRTFTLMFFECAEVYERIFSISIKYPAIGTILQWTTKHSYGFESQNKKIIIISPCVSRVNVHHGNYIGLIDNGDEVCGYKLFTGEAFINAIIRKCIWREVKK